MKGNRTTGCETIPHFGGWGYQNVERRALFLGRSSRVLLFGWLVRDIREVVQDFLLLRCEPGSKLLALKAALAVGFRHVVQLSELANHGAAPFRLHLI